MTERRTLMDGLKTAVALADPQKEAEFVFGGKKPLPAEKPEPIPSATTQSPGKAQARVPLSTRMRADFAAALKRASLERQLAGIEPNTLQDILEQAVEPWLRANNYVE